MEEEKEVDGNTSDYPELSPVYTENGGETISPTSRLKSTPQSCEDRTELGSGSDIDMIPPIKIIVADPVGGRAGETTWSDRKHVKDTVGGGEQRKDFEDEKKGYAVEPESYTNDRIAETETKQVTVDEPADRSRREILEGGGHVSASLSSGILLVD